MANVETGPLTLSEILDRMFTIYRKNFLLLIAIAGLPYAFLTVLGGLFGGLALMVGAGNGPDLPRVGIAAASGVFVVVIIIVMLIFIFGIVLASIGTYAAVWDIQIGRTTSIRSAYKSAWNHLGAAILAAILSGLATIAGFVLLIIPGIIVALALSLIYAVIIAEDSDGTSAISRSWELTKGYRWKIFVAGLVATAISLAISYGIQIPIAIISALQYPQGSAPIWFTIVSLLGSVVGSVIPAPLLAIAYCLIYYDARVRKEGFDLQRLLDQLPPAVSGAVPEIAVS